MRKVLFRLLLPVSLMIAVALIFGPVDALFAEPISNDTAISAPLESTRALSARLDSNNTVITAPATVLPGHVYVLNNCEIVTEKPPSELNESCGTAEEPSSCTGTNSRCTTITASVTISPSRLTVVDKNDTITEIWSNTTGLKYSYYSLQIKESGPQGPEHSLTQEILTQYNRLLAKVDWSNIGRVY